MSQAEDELARMIRGLRAGDPSILLEFWNRYGPLLQRVVDRNLGEGLRRRFGPEDVVQSVCRTFFRRAQAGELQVGDAEGLWGLLCAITLTKLREKTRTHLGEKACLPQELASAEVGQGEAGFARKTPGAGPADAAEFSDQLENVLASLDEEQRQIVQLKLQDFTHAEVAQQLSCSERTIRRILNRVQSHLQKALPDE